MKIRNLIPRPIRSRLYVLGSPYKNYLMRVFYRDYSQNGETVLIRRLAKSFPERTFLEVGANDGISLSSTYGLVLDGWYGWAIEANPRIFERLKRNLQSFPNIQTFCLAISQTRGKAQLYLGKNDPHGFYSTLATSDEDWYIRNRSDQYVEVDSLPLSDFLLEHSIPERVGLLLIDTEGMDLEILQTINFKTFRPRLIITEEFRSKDNDKYELLQNSGYKLYKKIKSNTVWLDSNK